MGLDIKYPIGLMFTILGVLITIYGFATINDLSMYQKSFGINMNLWSGISMTIFGLIMLYFSRKKKA
jgi:hypothetical protein